MIFSESKLVLKHDTVEENKHIIFNQILGVFMCVGMKTLRYPKRFVYKSHCGLKIKSKSKLPLYHKFI